MDDVKKVASAVLEERYKELCSLYRSMLRVGEKKLADNVNDILLKLEEYAQIEGFSWCLPISKEKVDAEEMIDNRVSDPDGRIGYYSLIQYCPNRGIREAVTMGVVLLVPKDGNGQRFLGAKATESTKRAHRFFPESIDENDSWLSVALSSHICRICELGINTLQEMNKFIGSLMNEIIMTKPGAVKVKDDPDVKLNELFNMLVKEK